MKIWQRRVSSLYLGDGGRTGGEQGKRGSDFWNNESKRTLNRFASVVLDCVLGTSTPHLTVSLYLCNENNSGKVDGPWKAPWQLNKKSPSRKKNENYNLNNLLPTLSGSLIFDCLCLPASYVQCSVIAVSTMLSPLWHSNGLFSQDIYNDQRIFGQSNKPSLIK